MHSLKKNKVGRHTLPDSNNYYKVILTKKMWYWRKDRSINPWHRIES